MNEETGRETRFAGCQKKQHRYPRADLQARTWNQLVGDYLISGLHIRGREGERERERERRGLGGIVDYWGGEMALNKVLVLALSMSILVAGDVTYDGRALIINGTRKMLFSGSIHYPRSTPEMWPSLIAAAKDGGLDVIQTYVFWNAHEPVQGKYNFQGRYDLVRFIKEVQAQGLYVSLRVGPFIEAEWNYGGFPFWLHDVPGIVFRSDNEPFKFYMEKFVKMIVDMMKSENLYYPQGGPIILSQIENEYKNVEAAFHEAGPRYVRWAASMAVGLQTGVPWMMCKQDDAPDPVINACNGLICGETFAGPNSPDKPALWTENWTLRYPQYGKDPPSGRRLNELAFAVALFIAKKFGSFVNYYMYHGGTNFGHSASAYVTTSYYDQSPLDEYGLIWLPTWGHLRELHTVIKQSSEPLLWGNYTNTTLGEGQEAHVFETSGKCVAFLVNFAAQATMEFRNVSYELPSKSISILSDCKTVAFNTAKVNAQSGKRSARVVQTLNNAENWSTFMDAVPTIHDTSFTKNALLEQMSTTKDVTDYLWYTFSYNYDHSDGQQVLHVDSGAHVLHAFVNNEFVGSAHGSSDRQAVMAFEKNILLEEGPNNISLLSVMVGLPDSGAYLEKRTAGLNGVGIYSSGKPQNATNFLWGYQIGLSGEKLGIQTQKGSDNVNWGSVESRTWKPLIWYKTTFDAPTGTDPVVLNLSSMGKGEVWINGESIGRYWVSFKSPSGQSSQTLYHVPRSFLQPSGNLLVLFEEMGGDPLGITVNAISVTVCNKVAESSSSLFSKIEQPSFQLQCREGQAISSIQFASYGNSPGQCENYALGSCHSDLSKAVVEKACVGERSCSIPISAETFGGDPCPGIAKSLLVVADCI